MNCIKNNILPLCLNNFLFCIFVNCYNCICYLISSLIIKLCQIFMTYNNNANINSATEAFWQECKLIHLFIEGTSLYRVLILFILSIWMQSTYAQFHHIDSLNTILNNTKPDSSRVNVLYYLSEAYYNKEPQKAINFANQGLLLSDKLAYTKGISICLHILGLTYYHIGKFDSALLFFERRLKLVSEINDKKGIATTYDNMGVIYVHFGKMDKALEFRMKANDIYSILNEKSLLANGYTWIGNIYKEQGEYLIALENYLKAIEIFQDENDIQNIGYPLLNISSIYRYMKQYTKAKVYALDAKAKFENIGDQKSVGFSLYRLAVIYSEQEDYENTLQYLNEAKIKFEECNYLYGQTLANTLIGTSYRKLGKNDLSLNFFNEAIITATSIGDIALVTTILQNIGTIHYDNGDYLKALECVLKAEKEFIKINDRHSLMKNKINIIEIYSHLNQPDSLLKNFNQYQELSDSIYKEDIGKSIVEMQAKYEITKKDKEILSLQYNNELIANNILLLNKENEISSLQFIASKLEKEKIGQLLKISQTENIYRQTSIEVMKLKAIKQIKEIQSQQERNQRTQILYLLVILSLLLFSVLGFFVFYNIKEREKAKLNHQVIENDMKALRAQMNPHFIFNCVHTIERLLNDLKIQESKACLLKFSNLTRSVLENSMKKEIPLFEEIETLILYIELENLRFRNPFTYNILIAPGIDLKNTLIPPLILQPFIENSIKHGFSETDKPGHLSIEVQLDKELLICIVEDNGVGRKRSMTIKPLSGFKKESMGIKLTEERLQLISKTKNRKAFFFIDDLTDTLNNPTGTRVKLFLPYELSV